MSGIYCSSSRHGRGYLPQTDRSCRRLASSFGDACQSPSLRGREGVCCSPSPLSVSSRAGVAVLSSFRLLSFFCHSSVTHSQLMTSSGLTASRCSPVCQAPLRSARSPSVRVCCCCASDWLARARVCVYVCWERDGEQLYIFYIKVNLRERQQNPTRSLFPPRNELGQIKLEDQNI